MDFIKDDEIRAVFGKTFHPVQIGTINIVCSKNRHCEI